MLSERQLDANRRNAQHSTGPRTPEGRAAVSLNALRHGLASQTAVLPNENPEEFRELRDAFFDEYHPAGPTETLLVEQMAISAWRLRRLRALETGLFNVRISDLRDDDHDPPLDPRARAFVYDTSGSRSIETLSRYETRIERSFYRALHELQRLRDTPPAPDPPQNNFENQTHSQNRTPDAAESLPPSIAPEALARDASAGVRSPGRIAEAQRESWQQPPGAPRPLSPLWIGNNLSPYVRAGAT